MSSFLLCNFIIVSVNPFGRYPCMSANSDFMKLTLTLPSPGGCCVDPTVFVALFRDSLYTTLFGAHDIKGWLVLSRLS